MPNAPKSSESPAAQRIRFGAGGIPTSSAAQILTDTPCPQCDYNLIGLRVGQPCPECGRIIGFAAKWTWDNLCAAPIGYIRLLALGFTMMAIAIVAGGGVVGIACFSPFIGFPIPGQPAHYALGAAALWLGGLLIVCRPRPRPDADGARRARSEWLALKIIALSTQGAFLLGAFLWLFVPSPTASAAGAAAAPISGPPPSSPVAGLLLFATIALWGVAVLGWMPTSILLARYADWASDTRLAERMRNAVYGMVFFGFILGAGYWLPPLFGGLLYAAFWWMFALGLVASIGMFLFSIVGLAGLCNAAVANARYAIERDRRLVERMHQEAQAHAAHAQTIPDWEPPDLTHRVGTPRR